jgi:hypothetical protein
LAVEDASPYTAFLTVGDEQHALEGTGTAGLSATFTAQVLGTGNLLVVVVDALGNVADQRLNITTVEAVTDTTAELRVTTPFPLPGEPVGFAMTFTQLSGVTTLPVSGALQIFGRGVLYQESLNLSVGEEATRTFQASFLPGRYEANFTVSAGDLVNETFDGDQTAFAPFEVFLGKVVVVDGDKEYYIRVGPQGQPGHAVATTGATYALTLDQSTGRTLYTFDVGDATYAWDADQRTTTIGASTVVDEGSPALGFVLILALLGAALLARRRM